MFCTRFAWVCLVCLRLCKEEGSSLVSLQFLRGGIWACMRCPCLCLCWVWDGDYVSQLPYVWYYVGVQSSFQHAREECESKMAYVFYDCLICQDLVSCCFYFVLLLLGPECYVISLYFVLCSVGVSVCLVCWVFDSVCELLGETIRNLLLNVMDVFSVGGGALMDRPCMVFQTKCVLCL